jgi:hypothetical protein
MRLQAFVRETSRWVALGLESGWRRKLPGHVRRKVFQLHDEGREVLRHDVQ